jgi:hypothetical protein
MWLFAARRAMPLAAVLLALLPNVPAVRAQSDQKTGSAETELMFVDAAGLASGLRDLNHTGLLIPARGA